MGRTLRATGLYFFFCPKRADLHVGSDVGTERSGADITRSDTRVGGKSRDGMSERARVDATGKDGEIIENGKEAMEGMIKSCGWVRRVVLASARCDEGAGLRCAIFRE